LFGSIAMARSRSFSAKSDLLMYQKVAPRAVSARGERPRLVLQRVDERRTGGDALLGRDGGFVAWGADRGIGAVSGAVFAVVLRLCGGGGQADGGKNRNAPAHDKPFKLREPSPSKR
jgi:hypothetical protein